MQCLPFVAVFNKDLGAVRFHVDRMGTGQDFFSDKSNDGTVACNLRIGPVYRVGKHTLIGLVLPLVAQLDIGDYGIFADNELFGVFVESGNAIVKIVTHSVKFAVINKLGQFVECVYYPGRFAACRMRIVAGNWAILGARSIC